MRRLANFALTGLFLLTCISLSQCSTAKKISFNSMLHGLADREALARFPIPEYTLAQFSSYDRAMVQPGDSTWFANWDRSMFLREEMNEGRNEYVMFDTVGPGAVVRFWMTFAGENSGKGILRIYLDGREQPVIAGPAVDVLSGKILTDGPLAASVSEATEYHMRGHNLYLPIPYAKACKITYESENIKDAGARTGGEAVYYNINYRTYTKNAPVKTFTLADLESGRTALNSVQEKLKNRTRGIENLKLTALPLKATIPAGGSKVIELPSGGNAVRHLSIKLQAENLEQALRSTILEISFDGEQTVWSPVGDFFGTGYQIRESNTWYTRVDPDGTLSAWWVMPFEKQGRITLHNLNDFPVSTDGQVATSPWKWDERSMHFGARWHQFTNLFTGEMKNNAGAGDPFDINYVQLKGKGVYIGDVITLFNTVYAWWGEGDEKVYVDGEKFPSHIGTGTEDYYGYAWCRPEKFSHPFIAQPDGSGNFDPGYTVNMRFRGLDAIPFKSSLKFDMEMWHWTRAHINFAPTSFHYMLPGGSSNIRPDAESAKKTVVLKRSDLISPLVVNGKIEGEKMVLDEATGGRFHYQNTKRHGWSDNMQAFWADPKVGDKLSLKFISDKGGEFDISARLTFAADYGKFAVSLNGRKVSTPVDAYSEKLSVRDVKLGSFALKEGENILEITVMDARPNEKKTAFFGLDYLKVE